LIDAHHIGAHATGNETWAVEVARGLAHGLDRAGHDDEVLLAMTSVADRALAGPGSVVPLHTSSMRRLLWDLPRAARREHVDAILVQYTAPLSSVPTVVAIHDLSFTDPASSHWIPARERARMRATIRWSADRAGRIVALSRYTAKDLQLRWNIEPERIVVAYPAVGSDRSMRLHERPSECPPVGRPKTVLAVGNVLPRKNLVVLGIAVRTLRKRGLDVNLRLVGQVPRAGRPVRAELEHICGKWLTVSGYATEDELVRAYHQADAFCFPSLYEGFGLPVLEAMTAGVPTIVANATALPEAAGHAGALVDPHDPTAWADTLERVLTDQREAAGMRSRGLAHAARFSWNTTAQHVLDALRMVAT
jgi:glycosyltransferase involved in cell wall biosynthesis